MATLLKTLGVAVVMAALLGGAVFFSQLETLVQASPAAAASDPIAIAPGTPFSRVAETLAKRGLIESAAALTWYARFAGLAGRVKAGEYAIPQGATALAILDRMVRGRTIQYAVTMVEGWTFRQIRAALSAAPALEQQLAGHPDAAVMERLGHPGVHPEGRFFPDTYVYARGQSDLDILRAAYAQTERYLAAAWSRRAPDLPYDTPYEALIMASIVEKETGAAHERPQIAGVFVRRLQRDMKLQTDPTVIYGMGERFDGDIRRRDLREDTPYNTYVHKGLPPTPIAAAGAAAIDAALHPEPGTALYFVSRGDGTHHFSDTYAEHERAVQRYQLGKPDKGAG